MVVEVALTGGIASGKSAVASLLARKGAHIIDADQVARDVVKPGEAGLDAVVARFGDVLSPDGTLDRARLASIVFADDCARRDLNALLHPLIRQRSAELAQAVSDGVIVHVIPLLVESGQGDRFDWTVVVDVDEDTQVARLRARDSLSDAEARARLRAQASRDERLRHARVVIDNEGDGVHLREQVDALWALLESGE